ncbi:MAG TPA: hypothetical protein VFB34_01875, partial [Chloroflexota bacterium]|nr:hypothetical protein [Chloroflexota bacterium]
TLPPVPRTVARAKLLEGGRRPAITVECPGTGPEAVAASATVGADTAQTAIETANPRPHISPAFLPAVDGVSGC